MKRLFNTAAAKLAFLIFDMSSDMFTLFKLLYTVAVTYIGVADVARSREGPSPKSLDADENFKPSHSLFSHNIKICCVLRTFS